MAQQVNLFPEPEIVYPYLSSMDNRELQQQLEDIAMKASEYPLLFGENKENPAARLSEIKENFEK
ncbi:MAG TPA: hypothetical protein VJA18_04105 [Candidatus Nanoarchaeia archaeon]|nr:hypothetical protein [Candidatus Nanoarchaeia archaeon]